MFGTWIADAHYSVRRLWAHPGYALLAVLTLALGVGGTASTFRVAREVLFDPLRYPHTRSSTSAGGSRRSSKWRCTANAT